MQTTRGRCTAQLATLRADPSTRRTHGPNERNLKRLPRTNQVPEVMIGTHDVHENLEYILTLLLTKFPVDFTQVLNDGAPLTQNRR